MKNRVVALMMICALLCHFAAHAQRIAYYIPNPVQMPALKGKSDGNVMAGISMAGENAGYNLMTMYSPVKSVAIMLNHNGRHTRHNWIGTNFSTTEIGAGVYQGKNGNCSSVMLGYGRQKVVSVYDNDFSQISSLWMNRYFLQGAYSYTGKKGMIGVGLRLVLLEYYKGLINKEIDPFFLNHIKKIEGKSPIVYHELAIQTGIVRYDPVHVYFHINTFIPKLEDLKLFQGSVGLSLAYHFGRRKNQNTDSSSTL